MGASTRDPMSSEAITHRFTRDLHRRILIEAAVILTIGASLGLGLSALEKHFHIPHGFISWGLFAIIVALLVAFAPFIIRFYRGFAEELSEHSDEPSSEENP